MTGAAFRSEKIADEMFCMARWSRGMILSEGARRPSLSAREEEM